jgi:hypothetical protein
MLRQMAAVEFLATTNIVITILNIIKIIEESDTDP